jgi:hypothetical protein
MAAAAPAQVPIAHEWSPPITTKREPPARLVRTVSAKRRTKGISSGGGKRLALERLRARRVLRHTILSSSLPRASRRARTRSGASAHSGVGAPSALAAPIR